MKTLELERQQIHTGNLILVNRKYGYISDGKDSLIPVKKSGSAVLMQRRPVVLLSQLMEDIHGWQNIVPVSGWRSFEEQQEIWDDSMAESGRAFTEKYVAVPGHSEHQTGLAIDLGLKQEVVDFIRPDFPYTGICQTFRKKAADYGFIERYPAGKEGITGIGHEPWHFRYVGIPHAAIMAERDLTLEDYIVFIKQFPLGQRPYHFYYNGQEILVSYLKAEQEGCTKLQVDTTMPYSISGNNVDGFIITEWRREHAFQSKLRGA